MTGRLLADACALVVFHGEAGRGMSRPVREAMAHQPITVSAVTVWELTRKARLGKLPVLPEASTGGLVPLLRNYGYALLPLTPEIAERANALPHHHADPMDRMLIATALAGDMTILTSDRGFAAYGVKTLW